MIVLIDACKYDESLKRYSFLIPIIVFLTVTIGLWDVMSRIFISVRMLNVLFLYLLLWLIYVFSLIGLQRLISSRADTNAFLISYGPYVILPLWYRLTESINISLIICFVHSIICLRKCWGRKESVVYFIRGGVLILLLWKLKELGLK